MSTSCIYVKKIHQKAFLELFVIFIDFLKIILGTVVKMCNNVTSSDEDDMRQQCVDSLLM